MVDAGQPFPSINSLSDVVTQNSDGSFDLYFAPELPEDVPESNWIKTNPGGGSPRRCVCTAPPCRSTTKPGSQTT